MHDDLGRLVVRAAPGVAGDVPEIVRSGSGRRMVGPFVVGMPAVAPRVVRVWPTGQPDPSVAAVELERPATPGGRVVAAVEQIPVVDAVPPASVAVRVESSEFVAIAGTAALAVVGTAGAVVAGRGGVGRAPAPWVQVGRGHVRSGSLRRAAMPAPLPVVDPAGSRPVGTVTAGDRARRRQCVGRGIRSTVTGRDRSGRVLPARREKDAGSEVLGREMPGWDPDNTVCSVGDLGRPAPTTSWRRRRFVTEDPEALVRIPSRS